MNAAKAARIQEACDRFYTANGPCCAGCDWWGSASSVAGECTRSAPVPGGQRYAMLGITGTSLPMAAGHVMTPREHRCGEFKDEFDWSSLSPLYLRRIGRAA
jgi:hypothetical protein